MHSGDATKGAQVASLAGPKMPADYGMGSLGLLMDLGGSIFMAFYAFMAIMPLMAGMRGANNEVLWMFLFAVSCAIRSGFHRAAGRALIYGSPRGPLHPTRVYIAVSAVQTVIALFAIHKLLAPLQEFDSNFKTPIVILLAMFAAWPATLAVIITRKRFKNFTDNALPQSEDLGFESVAVLMSLMGVVGFVMSAFMLIAGVKAAGSPVANGSIFFMSLILVVLAIRSFLHAKAGFSGVRGEAAHTFHEKAQGYYNFGMVAAMIAGGGMLIALLSVTRGQGMLQIMPVVALVVYLLLLWPSALKRYFTERNFSVMIAGENAPTLRRAPDSGLTALGWLLVATSVTALATQLATIISPASRGGNDMMMFAASLSGEVAPSGIERWLPLGGFALQLWAGIELVTMSERHRMSATVFGVFGIVSTIIVHWDLFKSMDSFGSVVGRGGSTPFGSIDMLAPVVIALVAPVGALLLVNRKNIAAARVVSPHEQR